MRFHISAVTLEGMQYLRTWVYDWFWEEEAKSFTNFSLRFFEAKQSLQI